MATNTRQHCIPDIVQSNNASKPLSTSGISERFWGKVRRTDSCWLWEASCNKYGYGQFFLNGKPRKAHRVAYEMTRGPIPAGLEIDHLCFVRNCVRPDHMEAVTHQDNLLRSPTFQSRNAAKTHCLRGHAFDSANTHYLRNGGRRCRACDRFRKATR